MIKSLDLDNYKTKVYYEIDNIEVGYIIIEDTIDIINIVDVFVKEEYRRKCYALNMFNYIFNMFSNRGVKYMLEVRKSNIKAINLYNKLGFNIIHVREKYYKDEDAYIMEVSK